MINRIKNYQYITTENESFSPQLWKEYLDKKWIEKNILKDEKKIIAIVKWEYKDRVFSLSLKSRNLPPELLPDMTGLLSIEHTSNFFADSLVVYEPDLSERFKIKPPIASKWSKPEEAYFYYVQFNKSNGECNCLFNDGHDEYVGNLDLLTGELSDIIKTRI